MPSIHPPAPLRSYTHIIVECATQKRLSTDRKLLAITVCNIIKKRKGRRATNLTQRRLDCQVAPSSKVNKGQRTLEMVVLEWKTCRHYAEVLHKGISSIFVYPSSSIECLFSSVTPTSRVSLGPLLRMREIVFNLNLLNEVVDSVQPSFPLFSSCIKVICKDHAAATFLLFPGHKSSFTLLRIIASYLQLSHTYSAAVCHVEADFLPCVLGRKETGQAVSLKKPSTCSSSRGPPCQCPVFIGKEYTSQHDGLGLYAARCTHHMRRNRVFRQAMAIQTSIRVFHHQWQHVFQSGPCLSPVRGNTGGSLSILPKRGRKRT